MENKLTTLDVETRISTTKALYAARRESLPGFVVTITRQIEIPDEEHPDVYESAEVIPLCTRSFTWRKSVPKAPIIDALRSLAAKDYGHPANDDKFHVSVKLSDDADWAAVERSYTCQEEVIEVIVRDVESEWLSQLMRKLQAR